MYLLVMNSLYSRNYKKEKKKKKNLLNSTKKIWAMPSIEPGTSAPKVINVKAVCYEDI